MKSIFCLYFLLYASNLFSFLVTKKNFFSTNYNEINFSNYFLLLAIFQHLTAADLLFTVN